MSMATNDALFHRPGTFGVLIKHFVVVVGFEHQYIDMTNAFFDQLRNVAQVCDPRQTPVGSKKIAVSIFEYKLIACSVV